MAATRVGLISFSCEKCQDAPYIKDQLGCETPLETAAKWLGDEDEFYNCPMQFLTPSASEFFEKYDSYKNGIAVPPDYEKQAAKFLKGVNYFGHCTTKLTEMLKGQ